MGTHSRDPAHDARVMSNVRLPHVAAAALLAVGSAQATDAITFLRLQLAHGAAAEANPVVASLARSGMLDVLLLAKVVVVLFVVGVVLLGWRRHPLATALLMTFAVGAGLVGAASNVFVLLNPYVG